MAPILPTKKKILLTYLTHYIKARGYAPTLTEIARHFKLSSLATVHEHLQQLADRGFIKRDTNKSRGLTIVHQGMNGESTRGVAVPIVGAIAAGQPIEAIEDRHDTLTVPAELIRHKQSYILKVKGDSMIDNCIADGDYVIVEKTDTAGNGEMVVALLEDGSATLKRFYRQKNAVRLQPANKKYKPLVVPSVTIQGRVLGVIRQFR